MKVLFKIILLTGVVLFGFRTSLAGDLLKEKEAKEVESNSEVKSEDEKEKTDTLIELNVQVGDTLVFDDFDENDDEDGNRDPSLVAIQPSQSGSSSASGNLDVQELNSQSGSQGNISTLSTHQKSDSVIKLEETKTNVNNKTSLPPTITSLETKVYPNPALLNQEVRIEHNLEGSTQLTLLDMSGKTILQEDFQDSNISFNPPAVGMYIIMLTNGFQSSTTRLVVK